MKKQEEKWWQEKKLHVAFFIGVGTETLMYCYKLFLEMSISDGEAILAGILTFIGAYIILKCT